MKKLVISFLFICLILGTLFAGCGGDTIPEGTTGNDTTQGAETQNTTEQTAPTQATETAETLPSGHVITYSEYLTLNGEQKKNLMSQFESQEAFDKWLNQIKQDYEVYMQTVKPTNPTTADSTETEGTIFPTPTGVTVPHKDEITFMDYHEMSGDEQLAFINSFSSYSAFAAWHAAARDAYNETMIEINDTNPIDGSELLDKINGN